MNKQLLNVLRFVIFVGVGVGILYLMYNSMQSASINW